MRAHRSPMLVGASLALCSALAFGASTPLIAHYATSTGPWTIAALLYTGAALATLPFVHAHGERAPRRAELVRIAAAGILGAMLAPAALVWGLAHTGAFGASLVLALESACTVGIAALIFHEHVGNRVVLAAAAIALGALLLLVGNTGGTFAALGIAAVALATGLWAIDNAITGTVALADPNAIVVAKSAVGIVGSIVAALIARETLPPFGVVGALLAIGAIGYGASLRWYLLAQRRFGIARTASVFAAAPFVGAALAYGLGDRPAGGLFFAGVVLIAMGIALHVTERHEHEHRHAELVHDHAHRHDDLHHEHGHDPAPTGEHTHLHRHAPDIHAHPHAPDAHHAGHTHEQASPTQRPS